MSERGGLRNVATVVIIAAAGGFIASLFIAWSRGFPHQSPFQFFSRADVMFLAVAVVAIALTLLDFTIEDKRWLPLAGLLGLFPLGFVSVQVIEVPTFTRDHFAIGMWLAFGSSLVWAVGGVLALASLEVGRIGAPSR
ncbi:MAG: hypothetical protein QOK17_1485 [Sphingomonadales bacterium]|jgi:hypothetical protein|nr:hypothetical protein [Sphingomonadales bacterium]